MMTAKEELDDLCAKILVEEVETATEQIGHYARLRGCIRTPHDAGIVNALLQLEQECRTLRGILQDASCPT